MLDEKILLEIETRADAASPGPWSAFLEGRDHGTRPVNRVRAAEADLP